jgi:hypothetical protein
MSDNFRLSLHVRSFHLQNRQNLTCDERILNVTSRCDEQIKTEVGVVNRKCTSL